MLFIRLYILFLCTFFFNLSFGQYLTHAEFNGGSESDYIFKTIYQNGFTYALGYSQSTSFSSPNNFTSTSYSIPVISKYDSLGNLMYTHQINSTFSFGSYSDFKIKNDTAYVVNIGTPSSTFSSTPFIYYTKYNLNTAQIIHKDSIDISLQYYSATYPQIHIDSLADNVYIFIKGASGNINSTNTTTTDTLFSQINFSSSIYYHFDGNSNALLFSSLIPNVISDVILHDNKLYFETFKHPNNSSLYLFSLDALTDTIINTYTIQNSTLNNFNNVSRGITLSPNNRIIQNYKNITTGMNMLIQHDELLNIIDTIELGQTSTNNNFYSAYFSNNKIYAIYDSTNALRFKIFDANGNIILNKLYPKLSNVSIFPDGNYIHLVGESIDLTTTNNSFGVEDNFSLSYIKIDTSDYNICFSTYIGGVKAPILLNSVHHFYPNLYTNLINNKIHLIGTASLLKNPRTINNYYGDDDFYYAIFNLETPYPIQKKDSLYPQIQTACKNGLADKITSAPFEFDLNDSIPDVLYDLNSNTHQQVIYNPIQYQWQEADALTGPFTDITGAIGLSYVPEVGVNNKYYRRIAIIDNCEEVYQFSSDTASVLVNNNFAPEVDAGGIFHTCPNVSVTIGTTPAAINGTPPYQYEWSHNATTPNTTVSSPQNSVYTLTVTDANNCLQYDQAVVYTHSATIDITEASCDGDSAMIKAKTIAGLTGVNYQWQGNNMCCPNKAINFVQASSTQDYILTLTIPITGGGTCSTKDTTSVEYIRHPIPGFAGPDQLVCFGSEVRVGFAAQNGFTYNWAPSSAVILPANSAQPILERYNYYSNLTNDYFVNQIPTENPLTVIAEMQQRNCIYRDTTYIGFIEPAIYDRYEKIYCEANTLGIIDRTPSISETYSWTQLSGNAQIIGPTNNSQLTIDNPPNNGNSNFQLSAIATVNGVTKTCISDISVIEKYPKHTYQTSCFPVEHNGTTYTSDAVITTIIPSTTSNCDTLHEHHIEINPCISFCHFIEDSASVVTLNNDLPNNITFLLQWSVEIGSTNNVNIINNNRVEVSDNAYRQLKLTITSPSDSSIFMEYFIDVNGGTWNPLTFSVLDTSLCYPASPVRIGDSNTSSTTYRWYGPEGFTSSNSNPQVSAPNIGLNEYRVNVSRNGCAISKTAKIEVIKLEENIAGTDYEICENAYLTLGNSNNPGNYNYSWEPSNAFWQNGTDSSSANPEILISVSTNFIVSYADEDSICFAQDEVSITVNNSPTLDIPDANICKNETTQIGIPGISGVTYSWSPAIGLSCTNCPQPNVTLESSQTYTVDILFDGNCINPNYTDIVNINVIEVNSNMQDITFCPDGSIVTIGTDAPSGMTNYTWAPSSLVNSMTSRTTTAKNLNNGDTSVLYLSFIDNNDCHVYDTVNVIPNISLPPINAGYDRNICLNETTHLGEASFSSTATYTWSPINLLNNPNIAHPEFTPQDTGIYTFTLRKEENIGNCTTTDTVTIRVSSPSIENQNYLICKGSCQPIGFLPENNTLYTWSPAIGLSDNNISNPEACNLNQNTNYLVTARDNYGCVANATVNVSVYNNIVPNITITDTVVFTNTPSSLTVNVAPLNNFIFNWGTSPYLLNSSIKDGLFLFSNPGAYNFTLEVIDPQNGCTTSKEVTIIAIEGTILENHLSSCDSVVFRNQVYYQDEIVTDFINFDTIVHNHINVHQSVENYLNINFCDSILFNNTWYFDNDTIIENLQTSFGCDSIVTTHLMANYSSPVIFFDTVFCANETISIPFGDENIKSAGNYSYTFVNQNGCDSLVNLSVIEKPIHLFDSPIDSTSCFGDTLILNPKIIFGDSLIFSWANTNNSNIVLTDNYNDILTIQHPNDCEQSIPFNMHFKDCVGSCKLMLPTGFSPNNDGVNDQLIIFDDCKYGIEKFNIKIYNRWGELVFESNDILNIWDGYYKNKPAPLGVYTYHITYTKVASDKTDTLSGNVTLIK